MANILIVDDEQPVRDILTLILEDDGHRLRVAIHGRHALELIDQERPDLVIADVMMPVMDGGQLCRLLKARADTYEIPIILMSSAGARVVDGAGADAFIEKPFMLEDVEALVHRCLGSDRPGPSGLPDP